MFDDDYPADSKFEGFRVTNEKMISNFVNYAKSVSNESVNKLEEADIEEMLDIDNDAPVMHSWNDGEIVEMVLITDENEESSDDDTDDIVKAGKESL